MAKSKLRALAVAAIVALVAIPVAYAAGYFPGWPVVGGQSYCSSVSGTGTGTGSSTFPTSPGAAFGQGQAGQSGQFGTSCNVTVPAGPTNLPSTSTFAADTGLASGQQPQTVLVPAVMTGAVAQDAAPLTGATITLGAGVSQLVLDPAGTIAALTIVLPTAAQLIDGQELKVSSTQTITTLTVTAGANTTIVATATTTLGATTAPLDLIYHAASAKWVSG